MQLEDLEVYRRSMQLGEEVWQLVHDWSYFPKDTAGKQVVRACDSVAANLSEGFGRYHYNDNKRFCYYARGSLHETKTWLTKARNRGLIDQSESTRSVATSTRFLSSLTTTSTASAENTRSSTTNDASVASHLTRIQ